MMTLGIPPMDVAVVEVSDGGHPAAPESALVVARSAALADVAPFTEPTPAMPATAPHLFWMIFSSMRALTLTLAVCKGGPAGSLRSAALFASKSCCNPKQYF